MKFPLVLPPPLPQSEDAEEQRRYRRALSNWQIRISFIVAAGVLAAGWAVTPYGFARADDIRAKVDEAVKPVTAQVNALAAEVTQLKNIQQRDSERLTLVLANGVASELRFLKSKHCKESDSQERDRLIREMDRKQDEYNSLRGFFYNVPTCGDL